MQVSRTAVVIEYDGVNITEDISKYVIAFSYTDNVKGKADEVEITLDDRDGLFQNAWYPDKKSSITCEIIHEGQSLYCGTFYIDEVTFNGGSGDVITWHASAINPGSKLRTKQSKSYNEVSLLQIAKDIAAKHDLTVDDGTKTVTLRRPETTTEQATLSTLAKNFEAASNEKNNARFYSTLSGLISELSKVNNALKVKGYEQQVHNLRKGIGEHLLDKEQTELSKDAENKRAGVKKMAAIINEQVTALKQSPLTEKRTLGLGLQKIKLKHSVQNQETDLQYLARLAARYGLAFNVKPPQLIFYSTYHLEDTKSAFSVDKSGLTSFNITDKTHGTYSDVEVKAHNPHTNETITNTTELQNTAAEQSKLAFLHAFFSVTTQHSEEEQREFNITSKKANVDSIAESLTAKGFGEQYDKLVAGYSNLEEEKSITACVRFANTCKAIKTELLKIQAEGNKVTKDKDAFAGGQSDNKLRVRTRVEDKDQADAIAKAALHKANSKTRTGSLTMPGTLLAVAGNNFDLTGCGRLSGKYHIVTSTHTVGDGYTVAVDFKGGVLKT